MIKIYGKDNCTYCNMAKQLCEAKKLEFEYLSLNIDYTQDEFFEMFPTARTFPQIKMGEESIGGFDVLRERV